jgi:hypothetical protein
MKLCVFDIEGDGLTPSKIHCLSAAIYSQGKWRLKSTTDYGKMRDFLLSADVLVGHNIYRWDIPVLERLLGIEIKSKIIDTLAISWYLYPDKNTHGLAGWGEHFGVPKPIIKQDEWKGALPNETQEEFLAKMTNRCEEDVKINCKLWDKQLNNLFTLYGSEEKSWELIDYLMFKMETAASAEKGKWKLDVGRCRRSLSELEILRDDKEDILRENMPKDKVYKKMGLPSKPYKQNGERSAMGVKWFDLLEREGLLEDHEETVRYEDGFKEPNPKSHPQVKSWLFDLGWKPTSFTYSKTPEGDEKKVPQIRVEVKGEKVLCDSIKKLVEKEPSLEALDGITVLNHRISILEGFLKNMDDSGYITASIAGFTNTLRFRHKILVNLPAANKPYGDIIRGVLIAPEGEELCGSDMSSLEDRTKQHYMWKHDPDYVREMQVEDFDPHLALAEFAGALTPKQVQEHKDKGKYKKLMEKAYESGAGEDYDKYKRLYQSKEYYSEARHLYKTANYSCTYGAGGAKLALTLDISKAEGNSIVKAYRSKNWAINAIADDCTTKKALGISWLWNPVSKFWYSLRSEKDRFSTLNQGTGVYCFDMWIKEFYSRRPQITGQMHDEVILTLKEGHREGCEVLLRNAMIRVNKKLNLNRELDIDVQFGKNYAEIH